MLTGALRFTAAGGLALWLSAGPALGAGLQSPFDIAARRTEIGRAIGAWPCAEPPAPIHDVLPDVFYSDAAASIVDPARYAARQAVVEPMQRFLAGVARAADGWLESQPPQAEAARCAMAWLDTWSRADAMLGRVTRQGGYERKWTLAGVALAYLKLRDAPGLDAAAKGRIEGWLRRLMVEVRAYYDQPPGNGMSDRANNHLSWAALAVMATAVAVDDRAMFDWALDKLRFALGQIGTDGTLPRELMRAGRALHYHLFSVAPLVMAAEIAAVNGVDLDAEQGGALSRLVARVVEGLADPGFFAGRTGVPQDLSGARSGFALAWAEIWYARRHAAELLPLLRSCRPARNDWLGGNLTLAFGVPELPPPPR
jgi:poly(beta-D-mannuronate) lyase